LAQGGALLNKRDSYPGVVPDSAVGLGRGVLRQARTAGRFELARHEPSALLAPFVDYHWIVRWDLRGQPPHEQTILPHPNVHLVFEASGAGIYGVDRALFADYVGVSPKWVMRRARLHEAASRADSGEVVDWAQLAFDLGYADQAHLTRDFTDTIGVPPAQYAASASLRRLGVLTPPRRPDAGG
jgi:AraC-like DNA-binding protein